MVHQTVPSFVLVLYMKQEPITIINISGMGYLEPISPYRVSGRRDIMRGIVTLCDEFKLIFFFFFLKPKKRWIVQESKWQILPPLLHHLLQMKLQCAQFRPILLNGCGVGCGSSTQHHMISHVAGLSRDLLYIGLLVTIQSHIIIISTLNYNCKGTVAWDFFVYGDFAKSTQLLLWFLI